MAEGELIQTSMTVCNDCALVTGKCWRHTQQTIVANPQGGLTLYPCGPYPAHDFAVGPTHAVCNRCSKVVEF